jgi:hypothetical protein
MAKQLIRVLSAKYVRGHQLRIEFSDGAKKTVDFSRWLHGEVFQPLVDKREFKRFFIEGAPSAGLTARTSRQKLFALPMMLPALGSLTA